MNKKMADIDTDPFWEHELIPGDHTDTGENIPLIPGGLEGRSTWEPTREQEHHLEESLKEPN